MKVHFGLFTLSLLSYACAQSVGPSSASSSASASASATSAPNAASAASSTASSGAAPTGKVDPAVLSSRIAQWSSMIAANSAQIKSAGSSGDAQNVKQTLKRVNRLLNRGIKIEKAGGIPPKHKGGKHKKHNKKCKSKSSGSGSASASAPASASSSAPASAAST